MDKMRGLKCLALVSLLLFSALYSQAEVVPQLPPERFFLSLGTKLDHTTSSLIQAGDAILVRVRIVFGPVYLGRPEELGAPPKDEDLYYVRLLVVQAASKQPALEGKTIGANFGKRGDGGRYILPTSDEKSGELLTLLIPSIGGRYQLKGTVSSEQEYEKYLEEMLTPSQNKR